MMRRLLLPLALVATTLLGGCYVAPYGYGPGYYGGYPRPYYPHYYR